MLQVSNSNSQSLQNLLEANLADELREKRCRMCGGGEALVHKRLTSLPRVLLICLKRYNWNHTGLVCIGTKDRRFVDIPDEIGLAKSVPEMKYLPPICPEPKAFSREVTKTLSEKELRELVLKSQQKDSSGTREQEKLLKYHHQINSKKRCLYQLASVVSHLGVGTSSGHYVADVRKCSGWFRFDDSVVTPTNLCNVRNRSNQTNGYIFFYIQQDDL